MKYRDRFDVAAALQELGIPPVKVAKLVKVEGHEGRELEVSTSESCETVKVAGQGIEVRPPANHVKVVNLAEEASSNTLAKVVKAAGATHADSFNHHSDNHHTQESPAEKAELDHFAMADGWDTASPTINGEVADSGFEGLVFDRRDAGLAAETRAASDRAFLHSYTHDHARRISQARAVVLDLETTALTPFAVQVERVTQVGARPYKRGNMQGDASAGFFTPDDFGAFYADNFPNCRTDTSRRIRVIAVRLLDPDWTAAWDLDHLAPQEHRQLANDVLANKIVIGHNLGFDLAWLSHLTDATPARILDSMLIVKWHRHAARLAVHMRAADGDEACQDLVKAAGRGGVGFSLAACAAAFGLPVPDKVFQPADNWCVSALSPEHYEYCVGDVTLPLNIIKVALELDDDARLGAIFAKLAGGVYEADCEPALSSLARIHKLGLPISIESIQALDTKLDSEMVAQADSIIALAPELLGSASTALRKGTVTGPLREAIEAYLQIQGKCLPKTRTGKLALAEEALIKAGLTKDPVINAWLNIKSAASWKGTLHTWLEHAADDGRVRPLLRIATTSGRMTSKEPNGHGLPKDSTFRAIVKAGPGKMIIKADYSQIELRIAAVLVARVLQDVKEYLAGTRELKLESWIREALENAKARHERGSGPPPLCPNGNSWRRTQAAELEYAYYQVLRRGPTMATILCEGLDPHLLTGLSMAVRAGKIDLKGNSEINYLRANQQAIKHELLAERQAAKAVNFGLLYGMSASGLDGDGGLYSRGLTKYGLTWSKEEAEKHRTAWFELYPEFRFWHMWTRLTMATEPVRIMVSGYNGVKIEERRIWSVSTLQGREMSALGIRDALNYPAQGSGAELISRALARLPEPACNCVINVIHDELLLEAPADQAEHVQSQVVKALKDAWEDMFGEYGVPIEVESAAGASWGM